MTNNIEKEYFDWLRGIISNDPRRKSEYYCFLMEYLYHTEYTYLLELDGNRASDGIELRYRFGYENHYSDIVIKRCFADKPCSILEMMIALALECEQRIMDDPDIGDRTAIWFWNMIESLGLIHMTDLRYEPDMVNEIITRFLNHDYSPNGEGSLFTLKHPKDDMRIITVWYQMMWYLNENFDFSI